MKLDDIWYIYIYIAHPPSASPWSQGVPHAPLRQRRCWQMPPSSQPSSASVVLRWAPDASWACRHGELDGQPGVSGAKERVKQQGNMVKNGWYMVEDREKIGWTINHGFIDGYPSTSFNDLPQGHGSENRIFHGLIPTHFQDSKFWVYIPWILAPYTALIYTYGR